MSMLVNHVPHVQHLPHLFKAPIGGGPPPSYVPPSIVSIVCNGTQNVVVTFDRALTFVNGGAVDASLSLDGIASVSVSTIDGSSCGMTFASSITPGMTWHWSSVSPNWISSGIINPVGGNVTGTFGATPIITSALVGVDINTFAPPAGFLFTVGGSDITVSELASWKKAGNSETHFVGIYLENGTLLGGCTVDFSGAPDDAFLYGTITPIVLSSGVRYACAATFAVNGGDKFGDAMPVTNLPNVTVDTNTFLNGGVFFDFHDPGKSYGPVNFKFV